MPRHARNSASASSGTISIAEVGEARRGASKRSYILRFFNALAQRRFTWNSFAHRPCTIGAAMQTAAGIPLAVS